MKREENDLIVVRGAGDLATGVIVRLVRSGYIVAALETASPTAIRRTVAFSEAVYDGVATVEGIEARRVESGQPLFALSRKGTVPLLIDPDGSLIPSLSPVAVVDAIIAKRNVGTSKAIAPVTIALGPGFEAGVDVDYVIETNRGHNLGRVIERGLAESDTGIPGEIAGHSTDRVFKSPVAGILRARCRIGERLRKGDPILSIEQVSGEEVVVVAPFEGIVRGLLRSGVPVPAGLKVADMDPRCRPEHCMSISDKARSIGGGVLEALLRAGVLPSLRGSR